MLPELVLQHLLHTRTHEIHNLLWGVDNAERVCGLDRVALKEALVDGVQKVLLLAEILDGFGRGFDSQIKSVEGLEEFVPVKGFADQRVNNRFHLTRNHIAADKILAVEDRPNQPLGQKMLHQHFINRSLTQVGVQRVSTQGKETRKCLLKCCVGSVSGLNDMHQAARQVGHALLEIVHRAAEVLMGRFGVGEKGNEQVGELDPLGQVGLHGNLPVLVQASALGVFKDDVGERVALGYFLLDFGLKIVVGVLGLPATPVEEVLITKRPIGPNGTARQFWNKRPTGPPAGFGQ